MSDVRAITVKQPWAWAIAHGGKTVENRSRGSRYRGPLLIHAGVSWSMRGENDPRVRDAWRTVHPELGGAIGYRELHVPAGAVIAAAELVDAHPDADCCRPWGESAYTEAGGRTISTVHHLVLEDVRVLEQPVPASGALGFWRPPGDVLELLELAGVPL